MSEPHTAPFQRSLMIPIAQPCHLCGAGVAMLTIFLGGSRKTCVCSPKKHACCQQSKCGKCSQKNLAVPHSELRFTEFLRIFTQKNPCSPTNDQTIVLSEPRTALPTKSHDSDCATLPSLRRRHWRSKSSSLVVCKHSLLALCLSMKKSNNISSLPENLSLLKKLTTKKKKQTSIEGPICHVSRDKNLSNQNQDNYKYLRALRSQQSKCGKCPQTNPKKKEHLPIYASTSLTSPLGSRI